jgi:hypothetical protein
MCDRFYGPPFEKKNNQGGCSDCPYHHPERKRPNVRTFYLFIYRQVLNRCLLAVYEQ